MYEYARMHAHMRAHIGLPLTEIKQEQFRCVATDFWNAHRIKFVKLVLDSEMLFWGLDSEVLFLGNLTVRCCFGDLTVRCCFGGT